MDARLSRYLDRRLTRLRRPDLPDVAWAIVGHVEGLCRAQSLMVSNTSVVRIWGQGVDVVVRKEDWDKVVPYLRDGTFNPLLFPVPTSVPLDPSQELVAPDARRQAFYQRVLGVLQTLFTEDFPTSDL